MKNKNMLLSLITSVVSLLLIIPMFLNIFSYSVYGKLFDTTTVTNFGLFAEYPSTIEHTAGSIIFDICLIIGVVLAGLYLVAFILEILNVKLNYSIIKKVLAGLFVVTFIVALIGGIVFASQNHLDNDLYTRNLIPNVGFYLALVFMLASGALAFVSSMGKAKKATKKRKRK